MGALFYILNQLTSNTIIQGIDPKLQVFNQVTSAIKIQYPIRKLVDFQDIYVNYFGKNPNFSWLKKDLKAEKFALLNSDGFICQSLEFNSAIKEYGIKVKQPRIFFPIYTDKNSHQKPVCRNYNDIWKIVYVGNITKSSDNPQKGIGQFQSLIKEFAEQKIEFHIYPSPTVSSSTLLEYTELSKNNPYFILHHSIDQSSLANEISQYTFAIVPFFKESSTESEVKYKYANTLKIFNYIEAGLPILVSEDLGFQSALITRYNLGFKINAASVRNLHAHLKKDHYEFLLEHYSQNREILSLQSNIQRLIHFYDQFGFNRSK